MPGSRSGAEPDDDASAVLAPSALRAGARTRIAVGAAIVVFIAALGVAALLSFGGAGGGDAGSLELGAAATAGGGATGEPPIGSAEPTVLLVHVLGAVAEPGLVELEPGARVVDAIAAAGGLTDEADAGGVNLARPVADGEQLLVPRPGEAPAPLPLAGGAGEQGGAPGDGGVVRLNAAGLAELDTLPRIGPALAQRILDWRAANGGFTSVEQLREVAGIGDAVFAGLVDRVGL
ncbi:helix-hairpin-helix domain-containing protein [Agromyces mediolanus]|uniref:helix-hairpin-helix domain-containing protein n=1 Tax=Agromyces mediolanus TaxID=41986 RepID=UPI0020410354|nr:helix-hairpin-helix domain-containing protein [Agromyces mediolanus]MCM3658374.1 helix-hairpin-helix domain-containing protein [Agromyces mediolanus]